MLYLFPMRAASLNWCIFPQNIFLEGWVRWDAGWYLGIAESGYTNIAKNIEGQKDTAFFPLYPLFIRALNKIIPNVYFCGVLISNISFLAALILLFRIIRMNYDIKVAKQAIILISVYPFSLFYRAMYTESLFILLVVSAFYFGEKKKWIFASIMAAGAGATRIVGFLTIAGLLVLYLDKSGWDRKKIRPDILWIALAGLGVGSYMLYLSITFGNPLLFATNQTAHGWNAGTPLETARESISVFLSASTLVERFYPVLRLFYILLFFLCLIFCIISWKKLGIAYASWAILMVLLSFMGWKSMGRYTSTIFPLFISFALMLKKEIWFKTAVYLSIVLLTFFTLLFTHAYWVA